MEEIEGAKLLRFRWAGSGILVGIIGALLGMFALGMTGYQRDRAHAREVALLNEKFDEDLKKSVSEIQGSQAQGAEKIRDLEVENASLRTRLAHVPAPLTRYIKLVTKGEVELPVECPPPEIREGPERIVHETVPVHYSQGSVSCSEKGRPAPNSPRVFACSSMSWDVHQPTRTDRVSLAIDETQSQWKITDEAPLPVRRKSDLELDLRRGRGIRTSLSGAELAYYPALVGFSLLGLDMRGGVGLGSDKISWDERSFTLVKKGSYHEKFRLSSSSRCVSETSWSVSARLRGSW